MAAEPGISIFRRSSRRRRWMLGLGALTLLGLGAWRLGSDRPQEEAGAADKVMPALRAQTTSASGASLSPFWALAREAEDRVLAEHYQRAGVPSESPPPGSSLSAEEWAARRLDARWCAEDGVHGGEGLSPVPGDSKSLSRAKQQLAQESIRQLRAQGQPLAMISAEWLQFRYAESAAARTQAQERLQSLARSSRQPLAVFMALRAECTGASLPCSRVPASLWAEVDPNNRLAWLALLGESRQPQEQRLALLRAAEAPRQVDFSRHVLHALMSLPLSEVPGLRMAAQMMLRAEAAAAEDLFGAPVLQQVCRAQRGRDVEVERACAQLAERLWRDSEDRQGHNVALALAADLELNPQLWGERLNELKLVEDQSAFESVIGIKDLQRHALGCGPMPAHLQRLVDFGAFGEWRYLLGRQVVRAQAEALEQVKKSQP